uniref:Uncharacterized protein n=1 Tax=Haptolina ericina TaxID=156174 RepID=A0A7S3EUL2_9EUKA|mmetsp:Transcript_25295/g.57623  ORF Transcript_25295/g.57623 Transcript_25295/m.57623 type:complete len:214 (+) Transcript_25295:22-663(+)
MESTIEYNPPPAPPLVEYPDQVYVLPHAHHLLGELLPEVVNILWRVNFEEFCLLLIFVVPFAFALAAFLRWLTGRRSAAGGSGDVGALTVLLAQQNKLLVRRLDKMEQQLGDLQRAQRFGDLHKDMAGVVWGLNELKHDIARLQSPSHAGQVSTKAARTSGAGGRASPATVATAVQALDEVEVSLLPTGPSPTPPPPPGLPPPPAPGVGIPPP